MERVLSSTLMLPNLPSDTKEGEFCEVGITGTHWFSKALVPTWDMQVVFGQVCVQANVSAEIFRFPYGSRRLLAEGNHCKFVALQFFSQMISEMLWNECDLV